MNPSTNRKHWLEQPRTVNGIVYGLWLACALLLVAGLFVHGHPHFGFDGWFGFYAGFGFLSYCVIVLGAKQLRKLLQRPEDYYGDESGDNANNDSSTQLPEDETHG